MQDSNAAQLRKDINVFLSTLKSEGFIIGVDHHIRVESVLNQLGSDYHPKELKQVLTPLIAINEKQQEKLYFLCDQFFPILSKTPQERSQKASLENTIPKKRDDITPAIWPYVLMGVVIFVLMVGGAWLLNQKDIGSAENENKKIPEPIEGPLPIPPEYPKLITISLSSPIKPHVQPLVERELPEKENDPTSFLKKAVATWLPFLKWPLIFLPVMILILMELKKSHQRQLGIRKKRTRKPPYFWPIRAPAPDLAFLKTREYYEASKSLRERKESERVILDMKETLTRSISCMGFPCFSYKPVTEVPEYLVLIDLPDPDDHMAHLQDHMVRLFSADDIPMTRYFYNGDPKVCFKGPGEKREHLTDIIERFSNRRLIIMGECDALIDPLTGDSMDWITQLSVFSERAILTPKKPSRWGMQEVVLARSFVLNPAEVKGFAALTHAWETPDEQNLSFWVRADQDNGEDAAFLPQTAEALKKYLIKSDHGKGTDDTLFQWLSACAVYPDINFSLTLHLSRTLGIQPTEDHFLKLIRLPFFKEGTISESLRLDLMTALSPKNLNTIRNALYEVLKNNPPPKGSHARDSYELNLAVHESLLGKVEKQRLKRALQKGDAMGIKKDLPMLMLIEKKSAHFLTFLLPRRFFRSFFNKGVPFLGMRSWVRGAFAGIFSVLVFFLLSFAPEMPKEAAAKIEVVEQRAEDPPPVLEFAFILPGTFMMGSPESEKDRFSNEKQHEVTLTKGFYMQTTEVTQAQWVEVMGENPSSFKGCDTCPVESVSWNDAQKFIEKLNQMDPARQFRLPTEAEWEYAARGGTTTPFHTGGNLTTDQANYNGNYPYADFPKGEYREKTTPVKSFPSNAWGLYDMHGNVWEWCEDWYEETYPSGPVKDPIGPSKGTFRVIRGGSWDFNAKRCRSAFRGGFGPGGANEDMGFRLLLPLEVRSSQERSADIPVRD